MKLFNETSCPNCQAKDIQVHTTYTIQTGEQRCLYQCQFCQEYFSETRNTPLAGLRTPLSRIMVVIDALNDGMGINAAVRTFKVAKNTIYHWLKWVADLKEPLLLYALCHQFLSQIVEGDELYTKVKENKAPDQSRLDDCLTGPRQSFPVGIEVWTTGAESVPSGDDNLSPGD